MSNRSHPDPRRPTDGSHPDDAFDPQTSRSTADQEINARPAADQSAAHESAAHESAAHEPVAPETRDEELMRLRSETDTAKKQALLAQAEAENFRKRMRRDYEEQLKYAAVPLVLAVLEVRDNLFRALEASSSNASSQGLREGVAMCARQLDDVLTKHGVRAVPAAGEVFDPHVHEAISQIPNDQVAAGRIAHVAQEGFQMHERIIRPSQVVVSSGAPG